MSISNPVNDINQMEYIINKIKSNPIIPVIDDLDQIKKIGYSFWRENGIYSQDFYLNVLEQNLSIVYKNKNNRIIAVCLAYYDKKIDFVDIALLCVRKEFHRKGFGESILRQCIDNCVKRGYNQFSLHVEINNKPAYNLYKKIGFEKFKTINNYYYNEALPENRDAYEMHLIKGKKTEEKRYRNINIIKENQPQINYNNYSKPEYKDINKNFTPDYNINNIIYRNGYISNNNNNYKNNNYFRYGNSNNAFLNNNQNFRNDNNINNRVYNENIPNKKNEHYIHHINARNNIKNNIDNNIDYYNINNNHLNNWYSNSNTIMNYTTDYWKRVNHKFQG